MKDNGLPDSSLDQSLVWQYDAIHGSIDLKDVVKPAGNEVIRKLIRTDALERLRRVNQLGFTSQSFPSSDHSRYAHSLGTMHMMRSIINKINDQRGFPGELFNELSDLFPAVFSGTENDNKAMLAQHLLVAALLQDTGELPYSKSLVPHLKPREELQNEIRKFVSIDCQSLNTKQIFSLGCGLLHNKELLDGFSLPFLGYLITGKLGSDLGLAHQISMLRHMMDGVVDADRMDYVFRDAHHTFGAFGSLDSLIGSLLYYDLKGPVFADTGPVSNFLALRAYLYTTVYAAPASRFKFALLLAFLDGISINKELARHFYDDNFEHGLTIDDFLDVHDEYFVDKIKKFAADPYRKKLNAKSSFALDLLVGKGEEYSCFWLPPSNTPADSTNRSNELPDDLFFDTFLDRPCQFYGKGAVRIDAPRFKRYGDCIPLEECGGPFRSMIAEGWSLVPVPDSILLFTPKNKRAESWKNFNKGLKEGWLFSSVLKNDRNSLDKPDDTREIEGFSGPSLFISYAKEDVDIVNQVVNVLYSLKQKYYLFSNWITGIGDTPTRNSDKAVETADKVLMIVSNSYVTKFSELPEGYISKEFFAMARHYVLDKLEVLVLTCDEKDVVSSKLPWSQIGYEEMPFVGKALRGLGTSDIEKIVETVVKRVKTNCE